MYQDYVKKGGEDQQVVGYFIELEKQILQQGTKIKSTSNPGKEGNDKLDFAV